MDIVKIPDKILKRRLQDVNTEEIKSGAYNRLLDDMRRTMVEAKGIGLAANQVGKDMMLFVIDKGLSEENEVPDAFFNPEITDYSRETDEMEEGCLSIPKWYANIRRSKKIMFKAVTPDGKKIKFKAKGFLARVLQHETDHLNGTVIKDRANMVK